VQLASGSKEAPPSVEAKLTSPVGGLAAPLTLSLTVTVQLLATPTATVAGEQSTAVLGVRVLTSMSVPPVLAAWVLSPA
jgi:hypothetical protein